MKSRKLLAFVVLAVFATFSLVAAQSDGDRMKELEDKIAALEKKVDSLERALNGRIAALERVAQQGGAANAQLENDARTEFGQINRLVADGKYEDAKTKMADFMKKYGATQTARQAQRLNSELAVFGKDAPAKWEIEKWYQGESQVDLAGDKTTLLVFWEVWCPHCKREVPKLQQIYTDLKDQGLQVVGLTRITRSATDEQVTKFIADQKVSYPIAKENGSLASHFGVSGIPAAAVVKDGKVVWRGHPARLTEAQLKSWL